MATTVDEILVRIDADLGDLKREMDRANRRINQGAQGMERAFGGVKTAILAVGSAIATLGLANLGANSVRATAEIEDLNTALSSVFGGIDQGKSAVQFIQNFATRTPFDIQTLSRAFIQLGGAGIKPTEKLLTTLGDAASVTVNPLQTFESLTRIITRGLQGGLGLEELEQLVTAGIPVYKILNDTLGVTRDEISKLGQTADGAQSIIDALLTGLDEDFGGAMETRSKNLSVALSNLGIAANNAMISIGEGGLGDAVRDTANDLSTFLETNKRVFAAIGSGLGGAIRSISSAMTALRENIALLTGAIAIMAGAKGILLLIAALQNLDTAFKIVGGTIRRNPILALALLLGGIATQVDGVREKVEAIGNVINAEIAKIFPEIPDDNISSWEDAGLSVQSLQDALNNKGGASGSISETLENLNTELAETQALISGTEADLVKILMESGKFSALTPKGSSSRFSGGVSNVPSEYPRTVPEIAEQQVLADLEDQIKAVRREKELLATIERGEQLAKDALTTSYDEFKEAIIAVNAAHAFGRISEEEHTEAVHKLRQELDPTIRKIGEMRDSVEDGLVSALKNGGDAVGALRDSVKSAVADMIAEFLRMQVIRPMLNNLFSIGATAVTGTPTKVGPTAQAASGGMLQPNVPTLVGERGPELIMSGSGGGRVVNAHNTRSALSGGSAVYNTNVNVTTGVENTVRAEVLNMIPIIERMVVNSVADTRRRGGKFASAIQG